MTHLIVHKNSVEISASQAKVIPKTGLPMGVMTFERFPSLWFAIKLWLKQREGKTHLFDYKGTPSVFVSKAVRAIVTHFGLESPTFHAHAFRRGTCSVLKKCRVAVEDINVHMGWALDSRQITQYFRTVVVLECDQKFFHSFLQLPTLNAGQ
jgi:hypothetical protein